jgi:hypothetical protein
MLIVFFYWVILCFGIWRILISGHFDRNVGLAVGYLEVRRRIVGTCHLEMEQVLLLYINWEWGSSVRVFYRTFEYLWLNIMGHGFSKGL